MGYPKALQAAGAQVLDFAMFGDYQGTWWAHTDKGFVTGSFGSCSHCDAFEADFGDDWDKLDDPEVQAKLADFGKTYLECACYSFSEACAKLEASMAEGWLVDEYQEQLDWVRHVHSQYNLTH